MAASLAARNEWNPYFQARLACPALPIAAQNNGNRDTRSSGEPGTARRGTLLPDCIVRTLLMSWLPAAACPLPAHQNGATPRDATPP